VIVVDFIDMDARRDQLQVLEQFNKALRADKARPQIAQLSELGLVELTRKRQGQNIYELFGQTCPTCGGLGHLVHLPGESEREVAEPIEALRSAAPEPRTALRETWTGNDDFDGDSSSDLQELDLTNHPSYQERNRSGDNRRRRRSSRLKSNDPALKGVLPRLDLDTEDEAAEEPAYSITPIRVPKERGERPERGERVERGERIERERGEKPERGERVERERGERVERGERGDKPERGRNRREKFGSEPPQVVAVEMSPEEQDVYALMGISPIVLASEPIKDPKSTIIAVAAPGEAPRPIQPPAKEIAASPSVDTLEPVDLSRFEDSPTEVAQSHADELPESNPFSDLAAPASGESEESEIGIDPSRRRRRRRSSTAVSE
jgi:ribonuclease E